ncbi:hypothetical protein BKA70DRAFT_786822 [Coprinopsis sp. MPI-PUGE-AT-0042]|nr:hypothetical protein BKA70DRAFT_786822 [Coprinopsis sp. MPI-PUGE-AT-0042]
MSNAPNLPPDQLLELLLTLKKTTPTAARTILNGQPAIAYGLISLMVQMNAIDIEVFQKTLAGYQGSAAAGRPPSAVAGAPPTAAQPASHMGPPPSHIPHSHSSTPVPAIPSHMQQGYPGQYRTSTPPGPPPPHSQTPPFTAAAAPPPGAYGGYPASNGYGGAPPASGPPPPGYGAPPGLSGGPPGGGYPPGLSSQGPPYGGYGPPPPGRGYGNGPPPGGPPPHMQHPSAAPSVPGLSPELTATLAALGDEQKALIMRVISMSPEQIRALPPQERSTYVQIRATFGIATPGG